MKTFFSTNSGIAALFLLAWAASIAPVVALVWGAAATYLVAFLFYAVVFWLLYHLRLMVPGIAAALANLHTRYRPINEYLASIYPLMFFIGAPMVFSVVFQTGIMGDQTRNLDPRLYDIRFISFAYLLLIEIIYSVVWIRRAKESA